MSEFNEISFDMPKTQSNSIKVIGVGGGGSNAVNHMYSKQINGVDFVICNTDSQALENSPIPNKIQLGAHLTSGLGAGSNPEIGAKSAAESIQEIQQMLSLHTKMVFITAGMGGGTGTGAAPIIAKIAKDMDILTVGIVTMPFAFEGKRRLKQAEEGVEELRKNVDSLIVINNNKLREVYGNLGFKAGFSKADEVLSTAAKGIAEVITEHYKQNIDLHDAKTVLSNSGTAIMGSAKESGENRAKNAIVKALDSPLLNDNKITGAKNVLLLIVSGANEVTLDEIGEINDFIQDEAGHDANIIMGVGEDETLEDGISVTVVATGFAIDQQSMITNTEAKKVFHTLEDDQKATYDFEEKKVLKSPTVDTPINTSNDEKIVYSLEDVEEEVSPNKLKFVITNEFIKNIDVVYDEIESDPISEEDFIITNIVAEPKEVVKKEPVQQNLLFDLPLSEIKKEENNSVTNKVEDITVISEEVKPLKEKRYVLDDFNAEPTITKSSNPVTTKKEEVEDEALQFKVRSRTKNEINDMDTISEEISPLSLTISQVQSRSQERLNSMKGFNYKFSDKLKKSIDEISREPAYKRNGIELDVTNEISKKKTALKKDTDDFPLKSNNSFLHDNVD